MAYESITQYTSPNQTPGRPWGINKIVIHWWGDPNTHPTFEGVIRTLCSPARGASAHYVVEAGRVACIVDPDNRAWHAGDGIGNGSQGNDRGIGIECNPRQSDGDYQTIAELIRDLRKVYGDLPLHPHREFNATACPGTYDLNRLDRLARGQAAPTPQTQPAHQPAQTGGIKAGTWRITVPVLNVRSAPSLSAPIVATYTNNQTVNLDGYYEIHDGYVWCRYTAYSGQTRWISAGPNDGANGTWYMQPA